MLKKTEKKTKEKIEKQTLSEADFEKEVIKLAKEGLNAPKIGEELRKKGVHTKEHNLKISRILKKNKIYENPDLKSVEGKLEKIKKHLESNKQDSRAMREKDRIFSQLRKLKLYHKA